MPVTPDDTIPCTPVTLIVSDPGWNNSRLAEAWESRDLLALLIRRDVQVRYRQTVLGLAWALLQPLLSIAVFTVVFGHMNAVRSDGVPYPLFALAALLPWGVFANGVTLSSATLVSHANLIRKVYFPRMLLPLANVLSGLIDLAVGFGLFAVLTLAMGRPISLQALAVVPLTLLVLVATFGVSLWCSALNASYRDMRYLIPFLLQIGLFVTPVVYSTHALTARWCVWYALNPMVGVIDGYRWALLGAPWPGITLPISFASAVVLAGSGVVFFAHMEQDFADVL